MNFWNMFNGFTSRFTLDELVIGVFLIATVFALAIYGFRRNVRQFKEHLRVVRGEDKNLPESFSVMTTDGARLTLEREWADGKWRYVLDKLPYRFGSPDKEKERLARETPRALKMSPFNKKVLENMDILIRPGGDYDKVVEARYGKGARGKALAERIAGPTL